MRAWTSSGSTSGARGGPAPRGPSPAVLRGLKAALFVLSLGPLARLVLAGTVGAFGGLGVNPVELVTRSTGTWTLVFLCATLTVSPLRRLTGASWLLRLRRMLGLFAFFYGALHLLTYLWFEQWFDLGAVVDDVIRRPFITMGMLAFVLMVPLAATSTDAMVRRLGRRWGLLHRLVYGIAIASILHYWWHKAGKNDYTEVGVYALIVAALLAWRGMMRWRR
jgi:sulfoxide reductase heme-binding subunit YedZ